MDSPTSTRNLLVVTLRLGSGKIRLLGLLLVAQTITRTSYHQLT